MQIGLYYFRRLKRSSPGRVFTTSGRRSTTYHLVDPDGREVAMSRDDAVVAFYALGTALKTTKEEA